MEKKWQECKKENKNKIGGRQGNDKWLILRI